ncbi:MAG TPA: hypothetical protein VI072_12825 [Polyangiaceae bacterium]
MNRIKLALKLTCAAAVAWPLLNACGGDDRPGAAPSGKGGSGGTTDGGRRPPRDAGRDATDGSDGSDGTGGTGGNPDRPDASNLPGAPIVTITRPKALAAPTADVLTGNDVEVLCSTQKSSVTGAKDVDGSTVTIELLNEAGAPVLETFGSPTAKPNEYSARVSLTTLTQGSRISFRCSAYDTSEQPLLGSATIQTFLDRGPAIRVDSPGPGDARALTKEVEFVFSVQPAPLSPSDPAAAVEAVTFSANGKTIPVTEVPGQPGIYRFGVNFNDPKVFRDPPVGSVPIVITAKNKRTEVGVVNTHSYRFDIDSAGPVVNVVSPVEEAVVGGEVELKFTVSDVPAGVDKSSIKVKMGGTTYDYDPTSSDWTEDNGTYTFRFDTVTLIATAVAQVTINVLAADTVQNQSQGDDHTIYLDNQPPVVDLDPGRFRESVKEGETSYCTSDFDPLGDDAANDGQEVSPTPLIRALVWEQTNGLPSQEVWHYSGLNEASVYLYLQPNPNSSTAKPLVVDSADPGRTCDDINPELRQVLTFRVLTPLQPQGSPGFGVADNNVPAPGGLCQFKTVAQTSPFLCNGVSDMRRVIDHTMAGTNPVIFAGGQLQGDECTGNQWEILGTAGKQGWVCLAARAQDRLGNVGVSAPLRACLVTTDPGICTREPMPRCTDGCDPPPQFGNAIIERR